MCKNTIYKTVTFFALNIHINIVSLLQTLKNAMNCYFKTAAAFAVPINYERVQDYV